MSVFSKRSCHEITHALPLYKYLLYPWSHDTLLQSYELTFYTVSKQKCQWPRSLIFSVLNTVPLFRLKIYAVLEEKTANHLLSRYEMHLRNSARDETNHDISLSEIIKYVASVWLNSKKRSQFYRFKFSRS